MSDSISAGKAAEEAAKEKKKCCPKGGKHKWKRHGIWPSVWEECQKCGETIYWK